MVFNMLLDFFNFAILDLVDKSLSTIHAKIVKKEWNEALVQLEALSVFQDIESSWPSRFLFLLSRNSNPYVTPKSVQRR
jgi:hypothetical protein